MPYSNNNELPPLPTCITVHPSQIAVYKDLTSIRKSKLLNLNSLNNLKQHENRNKLSLQAKRKLNRSIDYLLYTAKSKTVTNNRKQSKFNFKVAFITLTLPSTQIHTDQEIKATCLNQFLVEAKKKWNLNKYVWKAERQLNGNLHFHILCDRFIPYMELRNTWNRIINKLGYVDNYTKIHHKLSPNSTDVHSLHKIKNVGQYLSKYMTKHTYQNRIKMSRQEANYRDKQLYTVQTVSNGAKQYLAKEANNGRLWGCSTNLSNLKGGVTVIDSYVSNELNKLASYKGCRVWSKDHFSCMFFESNLLNPTQFPELYSLLSSFIAQHIEPVQQSIVFNEYLPPNTDFDTQ